MLVKVVAGAAIRFEAPVQPGIGTGQHATLKAEAALQGIAALGEKLEPALAQFAVAV
jgi:hypothetical protein